MKALFYWTIKAVAWPIVRGYLRFRRRGAAHVPASGACILVANHSSYLDAICLGSASPRRLRFLIADDIYRLWRLRWFYFMMGAIPLKTEGADTRALRTALEVLSAGGAVGIFPEGRRVPDGSIQEGKIGVAFLAARSGVPVIPAAIVGAHKAMPVGRIVPRPERVRVFFGPPLRFAETGSGSRREDLARFADSVMAAIASLASGPQRGASGSQAAAAGRERR